MVTAPPLQSLAQLMTGNLNPAATWADLQWIRDVWTGKLVVKGLLSPTSAEHAVREGVDAIVVSNHGGRQLDGVASSISCLADIVRAVAGNLEIYIDGGIRQGSDIAKSLCLGATAALVGRATLYGVAAAGHRGAAHALEILRRQFDETLAIARLRLVRTLNASYVRQRSSRHAAAGGHAS